MLFPLYQRFFHSLRWNTLESITYQCILFGHQLALFKATTLATYGLIGTVFSIIYSTIIIVNIGFDAAIGPLFLYVTQNKKMFKNILGTQIIMQCALFIIFGMCGFMVLSTLAHIKLSWSIILLAMSIIVLEGTKKNLRMICQAAFMSKQIAIIEISTITVYVTLVWATYFSTGIIDLLTTMLPMLCISLLDTVALSYLCISMAQKLPDDQSASPNISWQRIVKIRLSNWLHQVSGLLYSSNFLIPFFSMTVGLDHAGIFKLISSVTYFITTIVHRIFGTTSSVLLAHTKNIPLAEKQSTFTSMTHTFNNILYGLLIFASVNYHKILEFNGLNGATTHCIIAYIFFFIALIDNFLISYEKFIATEEKAGYLVGINILNMTALGIIVAYAHNFSMLTILTIFMLIRICTLVIVSSVSYVYWRIKPSFVIHPPIIVGFCIFSFIFFLLITP